MIDSLMQLGWSEKESKIYLYLVEYGISWASEIAKYLGYPKSSVNFLADTLWRKWYLTRSMRVKTFYYEANISLLEKNIEEDILDKTKFLTNNIEHLREMNKNVHSKPKIIFFDGLDSCRKAYLELLHVEEIFYEFWAHEDLVWAFGEAFMNSFISRRVKRGIFCDSLGTFWAIEELLSQSNERDLRSLFLFPKSLWNIGSSIALYDDKVLILNLSDGYSWVRIENREFAETMKTIFRICKWEVSSLL